MGGYTPDTPLKMQPDSKVQNADSDEAANDAAVTDKLLKKQRPPSPDTARSRQSEAKSLGTISASLLAPVGSEPHGTFVGTVFNILSNIVGGGVLALPYAFSLTGWAIGGVLVIFVGWLSCYAMWALMYCSYQLHKRGHPNAFSYKSMMIEAYGPKMGKVVEFVIIWYTFGTCVTYGVITGQSLAPLAKDWMHVDGFFSERTSWTVIAGVLFFVCSCARNLAELKFTSLLAFITILYIILCMIIRLADPWKARSHEASDVQAFHWSPDILKAVPLFSVSYGCHYNIPTYYQELRERSPRKFTRILYVVCSIIVTTYLITAFVGYIHFGSGTPSYILETGSGSGDYDAPWDDTHFSKKDPIMNIGRLGMFVHFAFVFPLIAVACRRSCNLFLDRDVATMPWIYLIAQSGAIVSLAIFLACLIPNIGVVLDFNGSLFGVFLIITFPGLLLLKLNKTFPADEQVNLCPATTMVVMGLLFTVCGFTETVVSLARDGLQ